MGSVLSGYGSRELPAPPTHPQGDETRLQTARRPVSQVYLYSPLNSNRHVGLDMRVCHVRLGRPLVAHVEVRLTDDPKPNVCEARKGTLSMGRGHCSPNQRSDSVQSRVMPAIATDDTDGLVGRKFKWA